MGVTVLVNNRTVVHAASSGKAIASAPDFCLTPSPGGPVPIPYPNTASSSLMSGGSVTVKCDGLSIMLKGSVFSTSTGDEGGTAGGGVASHVIKGKATFSNYSFDVQVEGKNVPRYLDAMLNNGNAYNTLTAAALNEFKTLAPTLLQVMDAICEEACDQFNKHGRDWKKVKGKNVTQALKSGASKAGAKLKNLKVAIEKSFAVLVNKGFAKATGRAVITGTKGKMMKGLLARLGAKVVGKRVVASAGNAVPWLQAGLVVWDVIDLGGAVLDMVGMIGKEAIQVTPDFSLGNGSDVIDLKINDDWTPGQEEAYRKLSNGKAPNKLEAKRHCKC